MNSRKTALVDKPCVKRGHIAETDEKFRICLDFIDIFLKFFKQPQSTVTAASGPYSLDRFCRESVDKRFSTKFVASSEKTCLRKSVFIYHGLYFIQLEFGYTGIENSFVKRRRRSYDSDLAPETYRF